jgi:hypothetical protein
MNDFVRSERTHSQNRDPALGLGHEELAGLAELQEVQVGREQVRAQEREQQEREQGQERTHYRPVHRKVRTFSGIRIRVWQRRTRRCGRSRNPERSQGGAGRP